MGGPSRRLLQNPQRLRLKVTTRFSLLHVVFYDLYVYRCIITSSKLYAPVATVSLLLVGHGHLVNQGCANRSPH